MATAPIRVPRIAGADHPAPLKQRGVQRDRVKVVLPTISTMNELAWECRTRSRTGVVAK